MVREGELTVKQRNELLVVDDRRGRRLVLADNRAQTLALVIARRQSLSMVNVHARYLETLEAEGWLDRDLEFLPTDKQIAERQAPAVACGPPEFAVLIAYTKNANVVEVLRQRPARRSSARERPVEYFPVELRERFPDAIPRIALRREIIATPSSTRWSTCRGSRSTTA